jgi:hypothetical protein
MKNCVFVNIYMQNGGGVHVNGLFLLINHFLKFQVEERESHSDKILSGLDAVYFVGSSIAILDEGCCWASHNSRTWIEGCHIRGITGLYSQDSSHPTV